MSPISQRTHVDERKDALISQFDIQAPFFENSICYCMFVCLVLCG